MTGAPGATHAFAATFVDELAAQGCREVCLAPGSRSAPLAIAFARHSGVRVFVHIDERACGFFALGLARRTARPVALLCTSGTAAVEFHPAVVEAFHAGVPLVVCTADRPPELRDCGAGQAIDQLRLYGSATRWTFDAGPPADLPDAERVWRRLAARAVTVAWGPPAGPVHLNCAFREPLVPAADRPLERRVPTPPPSVRQHRARPAAPAPAALDLLAHHLGSARRPMIVAGGLPPAAPGADRLGSALDRLVEASGGVVVADPASGLRTRGRPGLVTTADAVLRDDRVAAELLPDCIVRLGAPPTSRVLRERLAATGVPTILLDPLGGWLDPEAAVTELVRADPAATLAALGRRLGGSAARPPDGWRPRWMAVERAARIAADAELARLPLFEGQAARALAAQLPARATVVLGQSLAIRAADDFWPGLDPRQRVLANRGASGIDGLVSTACGAAAGGPEPTVLLTGDLSLLHDLGGLWALGRHRLRLVVVVLDNDGGGIFSFLPPAQLPDVFELCFGTPLGLDWSRAAGLFGLAFDGADELGALPGVLRRALRRPGSSLVAVRFRRDTSVHAHRAALAAMAGAARGALAL